MASTSVLLLQLLLVQLVSAAHYLGGSVTFSVKDRNPDGSFQVEVRNRATFDGCQFSHHWRCSGGNCGSTNSTERGVIDSSTNAPQFNRQWCETETVTTRNVQSDKPFELRAASCCWTLTRHGFANQWRLLTLVDLGSRSDTGKSNRSPDIAILPFLRVPQNCPRTYKLMSFDPDGDKVRCRYGNIRDVECDSCHQPSGFTLDQDSCTLHYQRSTANTRVYGFEMVVEDFPQRHITLGYTDGSRSSRGQMVRRWRRHARSVGGSTAAFTTTPPWWTTTSWWPKPTTAAATTAAAATTTTAAATTTTAATTTAESTPVFDGPYILYGHTTTPPPTTTTTPPPTTTTHPWRHHTTTPPPPTTTYPWWHHTTTPPPPTATHPWRHHTTTPPPPTATHPWRHHTTTPPPPTATHPWRHHTTTPPPPTATHPWRHHTTTPPPPTATHPWRHHTTTPPPPTATHPWRRHTTTTPPPTTTYPWWHYTTTPPPQTTTHPWWYYTTTAAPTTTIHDHTSPLSKLPLQFSFLVDPDAPSCQEGLYLPEFLPPTPLNGARLHAEVNREVEIRVRARASHATIHDIIISGPLNITKQRTTHGEFVIRWTPIQDNLGDFFPICFAVEAVTGSAGTFTTQHHSHHHHGHATPSPQSGVYQSEMRCVLVEVRRVQVNSHVICTESTMRVEVEKATIHGLHADHLRLNDGSNTACRLHSNSTYVFADIPLGGCGTELEEDGDYLRFKNEITTFDNRADVITRKHLLEVQFYCQYPKRGNVSLAFTAHRPIVTVWDRGFGRFTYQFEFYPNDQYQATIDPFSYPVVYEIGSRIYMQIEATSSVNNTELFVESCRASQYDNQNYQQTYSIIENGCKVDPTVQIHSHSHSHPRQFRFSMEAFKFIGMHDQVYISCTVLMCEAGSPETRSSQGCISSTTPATWSHPHHHLRGKRDAAVESARHFVSQGPLRLKRAAESSESSALHLNLNLVFIAGCLLSAVGMITAVVMYKARMSKVKYQPLSTNES